jgi:hypothetical protein
VNTAHISSANASALGDEIVAQFGKPPITIQVPTLGWKLMPGDGFYLSMARYPSAAGLASNQLMVALSVAKSPASRATTITAEAV